LSPSAEEEASLPLPFASAFFCFFLLGEFDNSKNLIPELLAAAERVTLSAERVTLDGVAAVGVERVTLAGVTGVASIS
jgi:hypothetical protein